ncbi:carbon starvation protein, membrane protein [Actinobacillus equuli]|nr:carbon starvation protein, membrane protein [Actinobacillus equuli]
MINPKKTTPAYAMNDGVDYMPMSKTKIWLIQLLNIAGTGPILVQSSARYMVRLQCFGS